MVHQGVRIENVAIKTHGLRREKDVPVGAWLKDIFRDSRLTLFNCVEHRWAMRQQHIAW